MTMNRNNKILSICRDIYREMYSKSSPEGDWDKMILSGETSNNSFFKNYYLPDEQHIEILHKHIENNKLSKLESEKVSFHINLGSGPSSNKKEWDVNENNSTSGRETH